MHTKLKNRIKTVVDAWCSAASAPRQATKAKPNVSLLIMFSAVLAFLQNLLYLSYLDIKPYLSSTAPLKSIMQYPGFLAFSFVVICGMVLLAVNLLRAGAKRNSLVYSALIAYCISINLMALQDILLIVLPDRAAYGFEVLKKVLILLAFDGLMLTLILALRRKAHKKQKGSAD